MKEKHTKEVLDRLESIYEETDAQARFTDRIREIVGGIVEECYREIVMDMEYLKEGSFLEVCITCNTHVCINLHTFKRVETGVYMISM